MVFIILDLVIRLLRTASSSTAEKETECSGITEQLQQLEASIKQLTQNFEKFTPVKCDQ